MSLHNFSCEANEDTDANHRNDWGASWDILSPKLHARASERRGHPAVILVSGYIQVYCTNILITKFTVTFRSMAL